MGLNLDLETAFFLMLALGMLLFILICSVFHLITSVLDKEDEYDEKVD